MLEGATVDKGKNRTPQDFSKVGICTVSVFFQSINIPGFDLKMNIKSTTEGKV